MTHTLAIRPAWTPLTIALMVLGFVFFWPLGLAMLAYILWGERFHDMVDDARGQMRCARWRHSERRSHRGGGGGGGYGRGPRGSSGNVAFDDYREAELRRLEEERRKLDEMRAEFDEHLYNLRRARDQEEFDRFMKDRQRKAAQNGDDVIEL